jgi:hypothetical protein
LEQGQLPEERRQWQAQQQQSSPHVGQHHHEAAWQAIYPDSNWQTKEQDRQAG